MVPFATRMIASRLTSALCHKAANYYRPAAKIETNMGGAWREAVVAVVTEFGRTARINGTNGTDHGTGTVVEGPTSAFWHYHVDPQRPRTRISRQLQCKLAEALLERTRASSERRRTTDATPCTKPAPSLRAAACHACSFVSETSCEKGSWYLVYALSGVLRSRAILG